MMSYPGAWERAGRSVSSAPGSQADNHRGNDPEAGAGGGLNTDEEDAKIFVRRAKVALGVVGFAEFAQKLAQYRRNEVDGQSMFERAAQLLQGHPDLLEGFRSWYDETPLGREGRREAEGATPQGESKEGDGDGGGAGKDFATAEEGQNESEGKAKAPSPSSKVVHVVDDDDRGGAKPTISRSQILRDDGVEVICVGRQPKNNPPPPRQRQEQQASEPQPHSQPQPQPQPVPEPKSQPEPQPQTEPQPESEPQPQPQTEAEPKSQPQLEQEPQPQTEPQPRPQTQAETKSQAQPQPQPQPADDLGSELRRCVQMLLSQPSPSCIRSMKLKEQESVERRGQMMENWRRQSISQLTPPIAVVCFPHA